MPVTYLRPGLSPTGPVYFMPQGTKTFVPDYIKSGPNKGKEKRSRKRSTKEHMVFIGGPMNGGKMARRIPFRKGAWTAVDHQEGFEPKYNRSCRITGDRKHKGWYVYSDELDVMEWAQPPPG